MTVFMGFMGQSLRQGDRLYGLDDNLYLNEDWVMTVVMGLRDSMY